MKSARCRYNDGYYNENNVYYHRKLKGRLGTIVGESRDKRCWKVIWDGTKSRRDAYKDSIEIVPD